jgi:hypothetical protein
MKRTKETLKGSSAQNAYVLRSLLGEYSEYVPRRIDNSHGNNLSRETIEKVEQFYLSDEISRQSPNSKDFVTLLEGNQRRLSMESVEV